MRPDCPPLPSPSHLLPLIAEVTVPLGGTPCLGRAGACCQDDQRWQQEARTGSRSISCSPGGGRGSTRGVWVVPQEGVQGKGSGVTRCPLRAPLGSHGVPGCVGHRWAPSQGGTRGGPWELCVVTMDQKTEGQVDSILGLGVLQESVRACG